MSVDREQGLPRRQPDLHADGGDPGADREANQKDREAAWSAIDTFAKSGTGRPKDLPMLIRRVAFDEGVVDKMPDIAKQIDGDLALECARTAHMPLVAALKTAFAAKTQPSAPAVKWYLQEQPMYQLSALGDDAAVVASVRALLPGAFSDVLPELAAIPHYMHAKPRLVAWFLDTTNPTIAALRLAQAGRNPVLIDTLDGLPDGWSWLDHLHVAASRTYGAALEDMAAMTKNAAAKTKLEAAARQFTKDDNQRKTEELDARAELDHQLVAKDDAKLVETAARTQQSVSGDAKKVEKRLAGKSPELVLEFLATTKQTPELALELIDGAAGATAEHVREVMRQFESVDVVKALAHDRTRKLVRKHLGRDASLLGLFGHFAFASIHQAILADAALRQWVYEDGQPETLLQLAAGSPDGAAEGTRIVKREKTNAWVKKLSPAADEASLRRFALSSTDAAATKYVKETLLRDPPDAVVDPGENDVVKPDPLIYGTGVKTQLAIATAPVGADGETAVTRLADLDEAERAAVLKDKDQMRRLLDDVTEQHLVRAMFLLRPTVQQLVQLPFPKGKFPELLSYLAMRPRGEGFIAAKDPAQIARIRALLGPASCPIDVFPELRDGPRLGKALLDNDTLFEWIMEDTEPSRAMQILAQDGVRDIAARFMTERPGLTDDLPQHRNLMEEGKRGYGILDERIGKETKQESKDYIANNDVPIDREVDERARKLKTAAKKQTLWEEIDEFFGSTDQAGQKPGMLALVQRAPAAQQVALLDGSHAASVRHLQFTAKMMPQQVFPDLTPAQLFALPGSASWLFTWEAPTVVMVLLSGNPAAIKSAAKHIDAEPGTIESWPRGGALTAQERAVLDELARNVTSLAAIQALFATRFDVEVQNFDIAETKQLWKIVARLPHAQLDQKAVEHIVEKDIGPLGQWAKPDVEISDRTSSYPTKDKNFDEQQKLSLADVKRMYGLSDDEVAIAADPDHGWLVEDGGLYTVKPVETTQFTATALHEIGHSIDTLLGEHTEVVYGLGGWRKYGVGQLEAWAEDMHGFDGIAPADRPAVIEVWRNALTSKTPVAALVPADHPARKGPASAPLVDAANNGSLFRYTEPDKHVYGDHVCVTNGLALYSMKRDAYLSAPSQYALSAPAEWFAECYVEYYRGYDGTPKTESRKGGSLATWVKDWFAVNVDRIRLNPKRVRKP